MSTWVIISWVSVAILTGINIFIFLKLKGASEQMMKMAFPNAKNMNDALSQMQNMMGGGMTSPRAMKKQMRSGQTPMMPGMAGGMGGRNAQDPQLRAAMNMLQQMQNKKKK